MAWNGGRWNAQDEDREDAIQERERARAMCGEFDEPTRPFKVGDRVWCRVHGAQGWYVVEEVGEGRNHDRIKVAGVKGWCPTSNFC